MSPLQIVLLGLVVGCGLFVAYPFVLFPRLLRWGAPALRAALRRREWRPARAPKRIESAAILFCAYNEAAVLRDKLENLLRSVERCPVPARIYVYLDGCRDRSAEIAAEFGDRIAVVAPPVRRGKSVGMRTLARRATEDLLVFTDANVLFDEHLLPRMLARFAAAPEAGCILGSVRFVNSGESDTSRVEGAYWRYEENLKQLESEIGSCLCGTGAIFAVRREAFVPTPDDIIDDLHTTLHVLLAGYRIVQADDAIVYERAATRPKDEWRRKVRIVCRSYNCYRLLRARIAGLPWPLRFMFVSHKLVRWYAGGPLVVGAVAAVALAFTVSPVVGAGATALGAAAAYGAHRRIGALGTLGAICQALVASTYGVYLSFRGERFVTWTPAESTR